MREQDIQDLIIRQRPYYHLEGTPIRGLENQYWLVFKHQDADSLLKNVIRFLGFGNQDTTHKLIRIDERTGYIITYAPKNPGDIPSTALLRTGALSLIKQFLQEVARVKDTAVCGFIRYSKLNSIVSSDGQAILDRFKNKNCQRS